MDKQKMIALVTRAQKNDRDALNELLAECYNDLYNYAYQTVKDQDVAADVTQESCMEIIKTLEKLRQPEAFMVWARRITYHQSCRYFRENQELQPDENEDGETILDSLADEDESVMPETVTENKEFRQTMQNMLDALPPEQRSALMLYYYEKLSVKDIAEIQNTSEGTVKSRLNYGRKAVKNQVEDYEKKTGVRLHSFAPLPLLLFWLFKQGSEEALKAGAATAAGTAATAAGTTAATVAATGATTAATTAAAGTAAGAVAAKVACGVLAAAVTVGFVVGGAALLQQQETEGQSTTTTTTQIHTHEYGTQWESDQEFHWQICACGEQTEQKAHTFQFNRCVVCGVLKPSEGLEFVETENGISVSGVGECTDAVVVIPDTYEGVPIVAIGDRAFAGCTEIKAVVLPEGITEIGSQAFSGSGLTGIVIPQSVEKIGEYAFRYCRSLAEVTLPNREVEMGREIFRGCEQLTHVVIPGGMHILGNSMFEDCSALETVTLEEGVTVLSDSAFRNCTMLKTVTFPKSLTRIGSSAFAGCSSLENVELPSRLETMGDSVFIHCIGLTRLSMPNSVTFYGSNMFLGCENLLSVKISSGVEWIGRYTFMNCGALTDIYYDGTMEQWIHITTNSIYVSSWDMGTGVITVHCADGKLINNKT